MPKLKVPLHRTSSTSVGMKVERMGGRSRTERANERAARREPPNDRGQVTDKRTHAHACACARVRNAADECVAMAPARRHRLGQVSDKARSRQVLRGLSVCARRWLFDLRPRARLFSVCSRAGERQTEGRERGGLVSTGFFSPW